MWWASCQSQRSVTRRTSWWDWANPRCASRPRPTGTKSSASCPLLPKSRRRAASISCVRWREYAGRRQHLRPFARCRRFCRKHVMLNFCTHSACLSPPALLYSVLIFHEMWIVSIVQIHSWLYFAVMFAYSQVDFFYRCSNYSYHTLRSIPGNHYACISNNIISFRILRFRNLNCKFLELTLKYFKYLCFRLPLNVNCWVVSKILIICTEKSQFILLDYMCTLHSCGLLVK